MKPVEVYKKTRENWCGNFKITGDQRVSDLLRVNFGIFGPTPINTGKYISVCGNDDFGMIYRARDEKEAYAIFHEVISMEYISRSELTKLGFEIQ